jgi:hypothetical protein
MLNVITLHPSKIVKETDQGNGRHSAFPRRHPLSLLNQEKSGRLNCENDQDIEIPALDIYAAR